MNTSTSPTCTGISPYIPSGEVRSRLSHISKGLCTSPDARLLQIACRERRSLRGLRGRPERGEVALAAVGSAGGATRRRHGSTAGFSACATKILILAETSPDADFEQQDSPAQSTLTRTSPAASSQAE